MTLIKTERVIVVSGLPRSGTSLVMSMLEAGGVPVLVDAHRPADESNPRGYFELEAVKSTRVDSSWVDRAPGHAVKVIHALLPHLPEHHRYDVLLLERDLGEVVASQQAMLARAGEEPGDAAALTNALRRQLDDARAWLSTRENVRWTPLPHRRVVRDPATAAAEIARFLGLALDEEAMADRVDPTLHRSRRADP